MARFDAGNILTGAGQHVTDFLLGVIIKIFSRPGDIFYETAFFLSLSRPISSATTLLRTPTSLLQYVLYSEMTLGRRRGGSEKCGLRSVAVLLIWSPDQG